MISLPARFQLRVSLQAQASWGQSLGERAWSKWNRSPIPRSQRGGVYRKSKHFVLDSDSESKRGKMHWICTVSTRLIGMPISENDVQLAKVCFLSFPSSSDNRACISQFFVLLQIPHTHKRNKGVGWREWFWYGWLQSALGGDGLVCRKCYANNPKTAEWVLVSIRLCLGSLWMPPRPESNNMPCAGIVENARVRILERRRHRREKARLNYSGEGVDTTSLNSRV